MTDLLAAAGFSRADATGFEPPSVVRRDGVVIAGVALGDRIAWEDGTETRVPRFPGD